MERRGENPMFVLSRTLCRNIGFPLLLFIRKIVLNNCFELACFSSSGFGKRATRAPVAKSVKLHDLSNGPQTLRAVCSSKYLQNFSIQQATQRSAIKTNENEARGFK